MRIIAITGSIGCGKTTIAGLIRRLGFVVYDIDKWCRQLYYDDRFLSVIYQNFPESWQNGVFNKRKLRTLVFDDNVKLKKLETLTHPFLKQKFLSVIRKAASYGEDVIFVDVALLFEMGWEKYCTDIIVANAPYDVQKQRVMLRDNISEAEFEKINAVQMSNNDRIFLSDYAVDTDKSIGILKAELSMLIEEIGVKC